MLNKILRLLLLTGLALTLSMPVLAETASEYFEQALTRFDNKEYRAAVILLKNALKEDPQHLPARILLGRSLLHVGDVPGAEKDLQVALQNGADEGQVIALLGSTYLIQGKYEQLLAEIRSAGRATGIELQVLVLRAYAYLQLGEIDQAEQSFKRASRLRANDPGPILGLATVAIQRGELEQAEQLIAKAERIGSDSSQIWFAKGEIQRLQGNSEQAIAYYDNSIERDPQNMQARSSRAALLIAAGNGEAAGRDIDFILKNAPGDMQATYLKAMLLAQSGKYKQALLELQGISQSLSKLSAGFINGHGPTLLLMGTLEYLQGRLAKAESYLRRYLKLQPHHLQPRLLLAEIKIKKGDSAGAILALQPIRKEHPDNPELLQLLGTAYLNQGRYDEASTLLQRAAELNPNLASVRTRLALSRLGQGDTQAAEDDLQQVLEMEQGDIGSGLLLVNLQLQQRSYDDALATTGQLQQRFPDNPLPYNLAGSAHLGKGDRAAARSAFEQALQAAPEFTPAQLNLAAIDIADGAYQQARQRYDRILRQHPSDLRAMRGMAKLTERQGNLDQAISWLERIRNSEQQAADSGLLLHLAGLHLRNRQPEQALELSRELGRLSPGELPVMEITGRAHLALGQKEQAARYFRIMQQSNPQSAAQLQRIAALLMRSDDLPNAALAIEAALRIDPGFLPALGTRIVIEIRSQAFAQAEQHARELQQAYPKLALAPRLLGDLQLQRGNPAAAAEAYAAAFRLRPGSELLLQQFRALHAAGQRDQATQLLTAWVTEHPDNLPVQRVLAALYKRQGNQAAAIDHYRAVIRLQPDNAAALNNLATLYLPSDRKQALAYAQAAYRIAPKEPAILDTLGWIEVQNGQLEEGLKLLRQAQARTFQQPEVSYHLAVALQRLGRQPEAIRELQAALASEAPFTEAKAARRLLESLQ